MEALGRSGLKQKLFEIGTIEGDCIKILSAVFDGAETRAWLIENALSANSVGNIVK